MGWLLKILALIVALVAIPFGAWIFSIPIFIYVFSGFIPKRRKRQQLQATGQAAAPQTQPGGTPYVPVPSPLHPAPSRQSEGWSSSRVSVLRYIFGGIFLLFALIGVGKGGTFSPFFFGGIGLLIILWGPASNVLSLSRLKPEKESILLRSPYFPFYWVSVTSVKLSTKQVGRAVAAVKENLLIVASKDVSILVPVHCFALSHRSAEKAVLEKMRNINTATAPLGAYLLPLDSEQASSPLKLSLERLDFDTENLAHSFSTEPYDVLSIEPRHGYVEKLGMYRRIEENGKEKTSIPKAGQRLDRCPLLWELITRVGEKVAWANADGYSAFLTTMLATRDMSVGERVSEAEKPVGENSQLLMVKSISGVPVELSRPQLRAIMSVYGRPKG